MSPTSSSSNAPVGKPRANLYTVLLVIALLAMIVGTVFLYYESTADTRTGMGASLPGATATAVAHANVCAQAAALGDML